MSALFLTLFVSLVLAAFGIVLFAKGVLQRDHEHADRLSLLPLEDDLVLPRDAPPSDPGSASTPRQERTR